MLDFEGNMPEPSWRLKYQVAFEDKYDDVTDLNYTMVSVSSSDYEANIDDNVYTSFVVPPSV